MFIFLLILLISSCFLLSNSLMRELGIEPFEAAMVATNLAQGNIGFELKKPKAVGLYKNLKLMMMQLGKTIRETTQVSKALTGQAQNFYDGAQKLSEWSGQQAASAEEVASSMEQMTASILQNADHAKTTEKISRQAATDIQNVNDAVKETASSMKSIADRITLFEDIVRQTNILSLNAAVEAARAGKDGRGFAVIATEIRKLSEKSSSAAEEINNLSVAGIRIADDSHAMLTTVVPNIEKTAQLVKDIATGSSEQNESSQQVSDALQRLNQLEQQNAAVAQDMAMGSQSLNEQALSLQQLMSFFKTSS